jgi:adenylylsulfate kinase|tara:strand:- start:294 stop:812 length:519 start_codon:yes stop_codon:yes gene_type:complete
MKKNTKGTLFWITGFSGSGKTQISKKIYSQIKRNYGPTILFSGDDIRKIFNLKGYTYNERFKTVMKYCKLAKSITNQEINVIFAVVGMMHKVRAWNKKNIKNYVEIYIKSNLKKIIKKGKKRIYHQNKDNIIGLDIKAEHPKNPHIVLHNYFKKDINTHSKELMIKIIKHLN